MHNQQLVAEESGSTYQGGVWMAVHSHGNGGTHEPSRSVEANPKSGTQTNAIGLMYKSAVLPSRYQKAYEELGVGFV